MLIARFTGIHAHFDFSSERERGIFFFFNACGLILNKQKKAEEAKKRAPPTEYPHIEKRKKKNLKSKTSPRSVPEDYHLNNSANLQIKIGGFVEGARAAPE